MSTPAPGSNSDPTSTGPSAESNKEAAVTGTQSQTITTTTNTTTTTAETTSIVIPSPLTTPGSTSNIVPSTYIFETCSTLVQNDFDTNLISTPPPPPPAPPTTTTEQTASVFGSLQEPVSFSDLAKTQESSTTGSTTSVIVSFPNVGVSGDKELKSSPKVTIPPPPDHKITSCQPFSLGPYVPPTSSLRTTFAANTTTTTTNSKDSIKTSIIKDDENVLLYSPPPTSSPPLDSIPMSVGQQPVTSVKPSTTATTSTLLPTTTTSTAGLANKIPKISSSTIVAKSKYESMDLITLQKKYRSIEGEKKQLNMKRQDIEKKISDMARSAQGKSIELDPKFRILKEQVKRCSEESQYAVSAMNKIKETLYEKYNYRIESTEQRPLQKSQQQISRRAKMSTGAKVSRDDSIVENNSKSDRLKKLMFYLNDGKCWCQWCDVHFDSVAPYCSHLQTRDHANNTKKSSTPWRSHSEVIDKSKTYDLFKSICAKVSNELDVEFSISELDKILIPGLHKSDYKEMELSRERSRSTKNWNSKEDNLFEPRGLHFLLPIQGFYCTLCSKTLCDQVEVNMHLRSHEHNYAYVKSAALNPRAEELLRVKHEKAYKKKYGQNAKFYSFVSTANIVKEPTSRVTTSGQSKGILKSLRKDEEIIAKVTNKKDKNNMPEIIPLSENRYKPSALKRLRTDSTEKALKDLIQPSSTNSEKEELIEINDDEEVVVTKDNAEQVKENETRKEEEAEDENNYEELDYDVDYDLGQKDQFDDDLLLNNNIQNAYDPSIIVRAGDPDSPFPDYDLGVCGNMHTSHLYDKRLCSNTKVILKRIDLDMYKDILLDSEGLWSRVNQLITKKEAKFSNGSDEPEESAITAPTFFGKSGNLLPVDVDGEDGWDTKKRKTIIKTEKNDQGGVHKKQRSLIEKLSDPLSGDDNENVKIMPRSESTSASQAKKDGSEMEVEQLTKDKSDERDSISPLGGLSPKNDTPPLSMNFLEEFFCDK